MSSLNTCTPEQQFLYYYTKSDPDFMSAAGNALTAYFQDVVTQMASDGGVSYLSLRRRRYLFSVWPDVPGFPPDPNQSSIKNLNEFTLLLPSSTLPDQVLRMTPSGTVVSQSP